ncbi:Gfo/Idh/MocA family oxidoreductase [Rhizobium sp. TRM95111]|uniref:Gfo/Idh/MocA family protein n=1 Tax=Rhizobium alarense TaxID=2846851 RepID=UPI001F2CF07B|nr:Gfo/Idh/MocA family oxidoreductase [Rhizobium alarense]MCF3639655.1 Gfo/Idh/MocA family oxidoreductase [Rhizobium alarense]
MFEHRSEARLAVVGAGLIGRRHADIALRETALCAIVDPSPEAARLAASAGVPIYGDLEAMLAREAPDGVIIATPNRLHVEQALTCVSSGTAVLVEKPIADDENDGTRLVAAAEQAGVPILVGHHRRHNPLIRRAKETIASGGIGTVLAVQATCWFHKPDDYFDVAWRRAPGAGPILVNLIHDVDLLRHLCGEVMRVTALQSAEVRGHPVEETAAILLQFANGALGTVSVSDTVPAPWSWELTAGENPAYPRSDQSCCLIGGTHGSLSLPDLNLWHYRDKRDWWLPIDRRTLLADGGDPLVAQMRHFAEVALRRTAPLVSGRDGLETLRVISAIRRSAETGETVAVR